MKSRMKQSIIGAASVLAVTIGLSSVSVFADDMTQHYGVFVGMVEVTSENRNDVFRDDPRNQGRVSYDPDLNLLSFRDAKITSGHVFDNPDDPMDTRIVAVHSDERCLRIEGRVEIWGVDVGIEGKDVSLSGLEEIKITANEVGIGSESLNIDSARVNIEVASPDGIGIDTESSTGVSAAKLNIFAGKNGIRTCNFFGSNGMTQVDIMSEGTCIDCLDKALFAGGTYNFMQTGEATEKAIEEHYSGVYADKIVADEATSYINVDARYAGLFARKDLTLKECVVNIENAKLGITSDEDMLITDNAYVNAVCSQVAVSASSLILNEKISVPAYGDFMWGMAEEYGFKNMIMYVTGDRETPSQIAVIIPGDLTYVPAEEATVMSKGHTAFYVGPSFSMDPKDQFWFEDAEGTKLIKDHSSIEIPKLRFAIPDVTGMNKDEAQKTLKTFMKETQINVGIKFEMVENNDASKSNTVYVTSPVAGTMISEDSLDVIVYVYDAPASAPKATVTATPVPTKDVVPTTPATPTITPTKAAEPTEAPADSVRSFVDRIYTNVLDREPEEEGAAFWTSELESQSRTGAEVAQGFIFSQEFSDRNLSDREFVTVLYRTFFGREPEEEGLKFWEDQLKTEAMNRDEVANGFIFSEEWADTCAAYGIKSGADQAPVESADPVTSFVERMYTTALGREAELEGLSFWADMLKSKTVTGEQVGSAFFMSDEIENCNLSNEEYLDRLYRTFMDREADEDGKAYWLSVMEGVTDRSDIVLGFTRSPEFVARCEAADILAY